MFDYLSSETCYVFQYVIIYYYSIFNRIAKYRYVVFVRENEVQKALTSLAIERTLLDFGKPVYEKVTNMLYKNYHCYIPDCYDHPEYLRDILGKIYGNAHHAIVESIHKQLDEFSYKKPVERFLEVISR